MAQYMLLLHHDPTGWPRLTPEQMQLAMEKYMGWAKRPYVVGSHRLTTDASRVIRVDNGKPLVTDGPYSETKEVLGGYYTIEAANYDEAVKLALDHPHVEYGGTVEIRQIWAE